MHHAQTFNAGEGFGGILVLWKPIDWLLSAIGLVDQVRSMMDPSHWFTRLLFWPHLDWLATIVGIVLLALLIYRDSQSGPATSAVQQNEIEETPTVNEPEVVDSPRLSDRELSFEVKQRDNRIILVVGNPQAERKHGYSLSLEELLLFSPTLRRFVRAQQSDQVREDNQLIPPNTTARWLYHGRVHEYLLFWWLNGKARIRCYVRDGGYHDIGLSAGTWRVTIRVEWQKRSRPHDVFLCWDGHGKPVALTPDPTTSGD